MEYRPIYYRFAFDPTDGSVELSHNGEEHPAWVRYHTGLGGDNLLHGYAYRIDGGWRLTDWEHQPLEDRYVLGQVLRRLREEEGEPVAQPAQEEWAFADDPAFDKLHYGLPMAAARRQANDDPEPPTLCPKGHRIPETNVDVNAQMIACPTCVAWYPREKCTTNDALPLFDIDD